MAKRSLVNVEGLDELKQAFIRCGASAPRYAAKALWEEASEAFLLSQTVVPVRYGDLRASGVVHAPEVRGTVAHADITYGGVAAPYAVYVHEIPPSRAKHDPPTRWKYLERPVKLQAEGLGNRMAVRVLDMLHREAFE